MTRLLAEVKAFEVPVAFRRTWVQARGRNHSIADLNAAIFLFVESGKLVPLLDDFLPPFPGFFLYFPQRRNMAPKMRALIEHARQWR